MLVVERVDPSAVSGTERRRRDHALHVITCRIPLDKGNDSEGFDRGCTRKRAHGAPQAVTSLSTEKRHF
jgi:hypothetical protein